MFETFSIHKPLLFLRGYLNDTVFKNQHTMQKLNSTATQSKKKCILQDKRKLNNSKVHLLEDYKRKGCCMECIHFQETIVPSYILLQSLLGIYQQCEKCEMTNNCSIK
jgi:hypothetical protein